jgi:hypothetical protein
MVRRFREWQPDVSWLFPPSPRDWLPESHLVDVLLDVTAQIDISPIIDDYTSEDGTTASRRHALRAANADPRMMLVLLLDAYSQGVFSSRKSWPAVPQTLRPPLMTNSSVTFRAMKFQRN